MIFRFRPPPLSSLSWMTLGFCALLGGLAHAELPENMTSDQKPAELKDVGITEHLGDRLNLDEMVKDESGQLVRLGSFFHPNEPVSLSLVYYSCPGLCNYHLNGLIDGLKQVDWSAGQKFQVIALSFDPREDSAMATAKKASYMKLYHRPGTENGFHFLTADEATIHRIASTVGFNYKWDPEHNQWAHASAAILLTPDGQIARYLDGILFDVPTLKMGLNEAGNGRVGTFVDQVIWFCSHYDPHQSKYTIYAFRLVQLGGILMVLILGLILAPNWLKARRPNA